MKELVAFLRRRLPNAHLRSAHASLHALLIHARSVAAAEAMLVGAIPHLLFALSSSDQKTRKRAARMLSLLLEANAMEATAILSRLECAAPLLRLLRYGDFAERAEAVDLIYLLRGSTQVCCTPVERVGDIAMKGMMWTLGWLAFRLLGRDAGCAILGVVGFR